MKKFNTLSSRLTLAFLLVGILGIALVTTFHTRSTRHEFDRFVTEGRGHDFGDGRGDDFDDERGSRGDGFSSRGDRSQSENLFLRNVVRTSALGAVGAVVAALLVGAVLSRGLTQPIRALTAATQRMAEGELGTQVAVSGRRDEIGRLATSFNKMSADLAQSSQKRQQMTADIAHDLRTPLTILRGYMEGIRDGTVENSPQVIDIMYEEVTHLEHLVNDLRTLSLADAGQLPLDKQPIHPRSLLERTGLAYIMQAEQKGLALRIEADNALPEIHVDVERMTQVLNNLVSNALRFTEQGEIVLSAKLQDGTMLLRVRDTGQGISADALPHIFDRFYRVDQSRQRDTTGVASSGLGLAIIEAIVKAHGGDVSVMSEGENMGSQFVVTVPVQL